MNSLCILWAQYGPYHLARVSALRKLAGPVQVHALEMAGRTTDYEWKRSAGGADLITLCPNAVAEKLGFAEVFQNARRIFKKCHAEVCLLPSYAPKQSLAALLAAKSLGLRTVMMNESHAGTAQAGLFGTWMKRRLVGLFDAAMVGGRPQKRYFASLGMSEEKIFTGYDAVDNEYFRRRANEARSRKREISDQLRLPDQYFLSLGRFVAKKNLGTLIRAYGKFLAASPHQRIHLVMVGSGAEEPGLRSLCAELRLPVYDKSGGKSGDPRPDSGSAFPGVHFYGFRQIDENPDFYGLADAFILPSTREEWGLVVNEAMACGLPVVVSKTAGCAEDLLEPGSPGGVDAVVSGTDWPEGTMNLRVLLRRNGFVFNPASVEELCVLLLALEANPGLRGRMARESRRIVEKFSCQNFAENALKAAWAALGERPQLRGRNEDSERSTAAPINSGDVAVADVSAAGGKR